MAVFRHWIRSQGAKRKEGSLLPEQAGEQAGKPGNFNLTRQDVEFKLKT